jgi:hypothetical protein
MPAPLFGSHTNARLAQWLSDLWVPEMTGVRWFQFELVIQG